MWNQLTSARFDSVFSWGVSLLFLIVCSTLILLTASEVTLLTELILIASLVVGWFVLGLLCPCRHDNGPH